jgi:hypothetical protein
MSKLWVLAAVALQERNAMTWPCSHPLIRTLWWRLLLAIRMTD